MLYIKITMPTHAKNVKSILEYVTICGTMVYICILMFVQFSKILTIDQQMLNLNAKMWTLNCSIPLNSFKMDLEPYLESFLAGGFLGMQSFKLIKVRTYPCESRSSCEPKLVRPLKLQNCRNSLTGVNGFRQPSEKYGRQLIPCNEGIWPIDKSHGIRKVYRSLKYGSAIILRFAETLLLHICATSKANS